MGSMAVRGLPWRFGRLSVFVFSACALGLACKRGAPSASRSQSSGTTSAAAPPAPSAGASEPDPLSLKGSAVALTPDESALIVADEDHEALFMIPASFSDPSRVRVVALPGPPAQVVALGKRVLVTVRTLPTDASRKARATIRGALPSADKVELPPPEPGAASSAAPAPLKRKRNTPAAAFNPAAVRQSRGGLLISLKPDVASTPWSRARGPAKRRSSISRA
jgi:hypothetical protein